MKTINIFIENEYNAESVFAEFQESELPVLCDCGSGLERVIDEVEILNNLKKITNYVLEQKKIVNLSCLKGYDYETLCFDVVLCDNEKIQDINKNYRNIDKPTDVISFAIFADSERENRFILDNEINLGEIIISIDKIYEQANENGQLFESELYFLLTHGLLHLLGFNHNTEDDFQIMVDIQNNAVQMIVSGIN